jgi:hypothetical protein
VENQVTLYALTADRSRRRQVQSLARFNLAEIQLWKEACCLMPTSHS